MLLHGLAHAAKNDAELREFVLEGRGHTDAVHHKVHRHPAEALLLLELADGDLSAKLEEIKAKPATASAKNQLEEMKKQMAAQKAAQDGKVEKTI